MFLFSIRNLLTRPLRSLLSLLGLTVAIAGMVGLFSVAEGLDQAVDDAFGQMTGLTVMQPGAPIPLFSTLPVSWGAEIAEIPGVKVVSPEVLQRLNVINNRLIVSPPRFLAGIELSNRAELTTDFYANSLKAGRFLTRDDIGTTNCVISRAIADEFNTALGDTITVNNVNGTVVGIYETGSVLLDVVVLMDITKVRDITRFDPGTVSDFYIEPESGVDPENLAVTIREHFKGREATPWRPPSMSLTEGGGNPLVDLINQFDAAIKAIGGEDAETPEPAPSTGAAKPAAKPAATPVVSQSAASLAAAAPADQAKPESAVEVRTSRDWANELTRLSADLDLILTILTSIGMTIALLGIINTMLMSVTERIIEFGILKANGWSRGDVLRLITFESGILGAAGGVCGAGIGWAASLMLNAMFPERLHLYASPNLLIFSLVFSTVLGVLAGLYPAFWAMRMMPMDAIRRG